MGPVFCFSVFFAKKKTPDFGSGAFVVPIGIEPTTRGFSVHCSTN